MLKWATSPFRSYFNARFGAIHESVVSANIASHHRDERLLELTAPLPTVAAQMADVHRVVGQLEGSTAAQRDEAVASSSLLGRTLDELRQQVADVARAVEDLRPPAAPAGAHVLDEKRRSLANLSEEDATVANFAYAHDGWASQAGLWFNPPLSIGHSAGGVSLSHVNERIAEIPFVFRALGSLAAGSRVVDVGATESTVSLSLATLGYHVTAVDPRPYPLDHPLLTTFQGPIGEFTADEPFDAVVLLSSIEHFGVGAYELDVTADADLDAMARLHELTRPGGRLVLTTPFGWQATTDLQRTYDPERLEQLLAGWTIEHESYLTRVSDTQWEYRADRPTKDDGEHVVLVSGVRAER